MISKKKSNYSLYFDISNPRYDMTKAIVNLNGH